MNPDQWLDEYDEIGSDENYMRSLYRLRLKAIQPFASTLDYEGLLGFYEEILNIGVDTAKQSDVRIEEIGVFQSGVAAAFRTARARIPDIRPVKGICFVYQYEFGEKSIGRVYLCDEYSDETDSWGKEHYDLRSVIEGPDVSEFFGFDPHYHWDAFNRHIAEEYIYGRLLAAVLEEWKASGIVGLPFGFASQDHFLVDHDHYMVRAPANEH